MDSADSSKFTYLLRKVLRDGGIASSVVDTYNRFLSHEIPDILESVKIAFPAQNDVINMSLVEISKPANLPNVERKSDGYYDAEVKVRFQLGAESEVATLCRLPIMIGSSRDLLMDMTTEERVAAGENPIDPGGYFIMQGSEKILLMQENSKPRFHGLYLKKFDKQDKLAPAMTYIAGEEMTGLYSKIIVLTFSEVTGYKVSLTGMGKDMSMDAMFLFYVLFDRLSDVSGERVAAVIRNNLKSLPAFIQMIKKRMAMQFPSQSETDKYKIDAAINQTYTIEFEENFDDVYGYLRTVFPAEASRSDESLRMFIVDTIFRNASEPRRQSYVLDKIRTFSYMLSKFIDFHLGYRELEDIDSWSFKKVNTAGEHMRSHFASSLFKLTSTLENDIEKGSISDFTSFMARIRNSTLISDSFRTSFKGQRWGPRYRGSDNGVVISVTLERDNAIAHYSHMSRIRTPGSDRSGNEKRRIRNTQYGYICPVTTSDNSRCGMVKDHTITTRVTYNVDPRTVTTLIPEDLLFTETAKARKLLAELMESKRYYTRVIVNGIVIGYTPGDGNLLRDFLVSLRRKGQIHPFTEIVLTEHRELMIYTDSGRLVRPLLVVNKQRFEHQITVDDAWGRDFEDLLNCCIEYIGILEGQYYFIGSRPEGLKEYREQITRGGELLQSITGEESTQIVRDIQTFDVNKYDVTPEVADQLRDIKFSLRKFVNDMRPDYTEISPEAILGVSAAAIPYLSMSPGPRLTYQSGMGRKALALDNVNMSGSQRISTSTSYQLANPDIPVSFTNVAKEIGLDQFPVGQQVICAFMPYGGGNEEDAVVIDELAIERGLFKVVIYYGYKAALNITSGTGERFGIPPGSEADPQFMHIINEGENIGLPEMGARIEPAQCVIAKYLIDGGRVINTSEYANYSESGVVDYTEKVVSGASGIESARVRLMNTRKPEVGDKISSRYSQKGVIGQIVPHHMMPRIHAPDDEFMHGVVPSILFNPHGIPTRMTVGKLVEMASGLIGYKQGRRFNASPFVQNNINELKQELARNGFSRQGTFKMYNPLIDRVMDNEIFVGPMYYQVLDHFVHKKVRARGLTGPINPRTRQPRRGIDVNNGNIGWGGIRFGHMEFTALRAYGMSQVTVDRGMIASDQFQTSFCECGTQMVVHKGAASVMCSNCHKQDAESKFSVTVPYSLLYMRHLLSGLNINLKLHPQLKEE